MKTIKQSDGKVILTAMVKAIQENKAYLGEVDGLIGDGDHGMNMNKGFSVFEERFGGEDFTLSDGLNSLAMILMNEIGGSMGPIYGTIFMEMADSAEEKDELTVADVRDMLQSGMDGLFDIVDARVGDKTLVDTLSPAVEALSATAESGRNGRRNASAERSGNKRQGLNQRFGCKIRAFQPAWRTLQRRFGRRRSLLLPPALRHR